MADDVTVLRRGRVVHAGPASEASDALLTSAMIGSELARTAPTPAAHGASVGTVVFRAERLSVRDEWNTVRVRDASFSVHGGEIVGVVGVEGAGQRELLRALAGRCDAADGTLARPDVVGFIPEDRHHDAVLLDRSLTENVALRGAGRRRGTIGWTGVRARTDALIQAFDVRAPHARVQIGRAHV